ncbi:hypothetical protein MP638_006755 [Amoeboaphelidium occidentale]|nr:hypothetical protein MP638_006755 [Amoeboaphelidium occidentale]
MEHPPSPPPEEDSKVLTIKSQHIEDVPQLERSDDLLNILEAVQDLHSGNIDPLFDLISSKFPLASSSTSDPSNTETKRFISRVFHIIQSVVETTTSTIDIIHGEIRHLDDVRKKMNALPLHDIKGRMNLAVECGRELVSVGVLLKELIASSDQSERALIDGVCEKRILPIIKQAFEDRE